MKPVIRNRPASLRPMRAVELIARQTNPSRGSAARAKIDQAQNWPRSSTIPPMKHYLDLLIPAFGLLVGLVACGCGSTEFAETKSPANPLDPEESDLILQLNLFRRDNAGINTPVIVCKALNVSASEHADDMRDKDYLSDMAPDGST